MMTDADEEAKSLVRGDPVYQRVLLCSGGKTRDFVQHVGMAWRVSALEDARMEGCNLDRHTTI
jgi:hypothetical protein